MRILKREICSKCYQKNEKVWDEGRWKAGYIGCPDEEFPGFSAHKESGLIPINVKLHRTNKIPKHCCQYGVTEGEK